MLSDRYWKNVLAVLSGTVTAQIIPIIGALVIARQYSPAEFGTFSAWLGIVLFLAVIVTGRFEAALAIVPDGEPRRHAVLATMATAIIGALFAAFICIVIFLGIPMVVGSFTLTLVTLLVPTALAVAFSQTWLSWAAAEGSYRKLSMMRIAQAAVITTFQIAAGFFSPFASALAVAHLAGVIAGVLLAFYLMPPGRFPEGLATHCLFTLWSSYRRFPMFSLPADGINAAAAQLPVTLVASRFGSEVAGLLALTLRIMGAPIGLLGTSVLEVFKRHAATGYRERGECRTEYIRTFRVLLVCSAVFCLLVPTVSEIFFETAFGQNWRGAGTIAIWLLPLFALRFIASPLSYTFYISGKQHIDLFWQITLIIMTISSFQLTHNPDHSLQLYSAGYSVLYIVYLVMSYRLSHGNIRSI